jgi:hypothetical protein
VAEARLVGRAVQLDHPHVQPALVGGVEARQGVEDLAIDRVHRRQHALAAVTGLVAIPLLDGLMRARGGARGHRRPAK